uniref:Aspartate beta-hydroxylase n=1 Tax=Cairina moschata TaxID=8855 RepID=A0A8C3BN76_CAIMO
MGAGSCRASFPCALPHWLPAGGGAGLGAVPRGAAGRCLRQGGGGGGSGLLPPPLRAACLPAMASRRSSRGTGGTPSPSPGPRRETKHGGSKNGKKEGLSGSSFFTWFMVIALLGVWTSVAVVWFELVDYEEVLGKLGIYDADGDGDFDVEDAKVLLGLKERSVPEQSTSPESEETIQPDEQSFVKSGEGHEDVDESVNEQWQEKEETHGETFEAPATDDLLRELENEVTEDYETPDSFQKDADPEDLGAAQPETFEVPVSYDYDMDVERTVSDPEAPGDSELMLEDAVEDYAGTMQSLFIEL